MIQLLPAIMRCEAGKFENGVVPSIVNAALKLGLNPSLLNSMYLYYSQSQLAVGGDSVQLESRVDQGAPKRGYWLPLIIKGK